MWHHPNFKFDQCFVVIHTVHKFHNIWLSQTKVGEKKQMSGSTCPYVPMYDTETMVKINAPLSDGEGI